jgi:hypothetical protein
MFASRTTTTTTATTATTTLTIKTQLLEKLSLQAKPFSKQINTFLTLSN